MEPPTFQLRMGLTLSRIRPRKPVGSFVIRTSWQLRTLPGITSCTFVAIHSDLGKYVVGDGPLARESAQFLQPAAAPEDKRDLPPSPARFISTQSRNPVWVSKWVTIWVTLNAGTGHFWPPLA